MPDSRPPPVETFGSPNLTHPYVKYSLGEAVALAKNSASLNDEPIESLGAARTEIERVMRAGGYNWITGQVALDVLDVAIDGRDLLAECRLV
ncbi:hypothetical protein [Polaromonas sp.]|uniref:hypothetical protein n=1 Tax=Polaromonas sp. TaxID=1869339 RepID=UPI003BB6FEDC